MVFVFFKQKTAYEMRISDWSSDVCSSDLTSPTALDPALDSQCRRGRSGAGRRGRSPDLHAFCVVLAEELARVEHAAVLPDFEMHVGAGGAAGRAGLGDLLAAAHQGTDLPAQPRVVRVQGDKSEDRRVGQEWVR